MQSNAIVTNVGGVQELVPSNEHGIILPSADGETIASAILELNSDRTRCLIMGQNINQLVIDKFSWSETARLTALAMRRGAGTAKPTHLVNRIKKAA